MDSDPKLPIPISLVGGKYLLFDIDAISWLRRTHHICGVMGGTLPQSPSQNVFLGLPMQIMPEEAQLLVEKEVAFVMDDPRAHDQALQSGDSARHADYLAQIRRKATAATKMRAGQKDEQRKVALSKQKSKQLTTTMPQRNEAGESTTNGTTTPRATSESVNPDTESSLFESTPPPRSHTSTPTTKLTSTYQFQSLQSMTPTTSTLFLLPPPSSSSSPTFTNTIPNLPSSYPLYRHLNQKSYFITPGLRFGCQYCVYPGDPLRFHSHFLAVGVGWDEEIDLMDLVGGGRLGTGVKKGFLIGGEESKEDEGGDGKVRMFSIEWAAM